MNSIFFDHTLFLYGVGWLVCLYGVCLFSANWIRIGRASFVYMCVTALLFGLFIQYLISFFSRICFLEGGETLQTHCVWPYRNYLPILSVTALVIGMTRRWRRSLSISSTKEFLPVDKEENLS